MSPLVIVLALILIPFGIEILVEWLNLKNIQEELPKEFEGIYDSDRYLKSQKYLSENTRFDIFHSTFSTALLIVFFVLGGFNFLDLWLRNFIESDLWRGLAYFAALGIGTKITNLPFSIYETFNIEERYGFNKSTPQVFVQDQLKGLILAIVIGGPILALLIWFFDEFGDQAWLYAWLALTAIQLFITWLAPIVILPLFNKFDPLPEGELKVAIENYLQKQNFNSRGLFTMDGSKRSTKANAFFIGFGKFRRIVLFDTLIEKQTPKEIVAVLAHEVGHYQRGHIIKSLVLSILSTGILFYTLGFFLKSHIIYDAFQIATPSTYLGLVIISILYSPLSKLISILSNALSRKFEFEADEFAVRTYGASEDLVSALKKLSRDSLSNLTPHPIKVFFDYTHPPVLERVRVLRSIRTG